MKKLVKRIHFDMKAFVDTILLEFRLIFKDKAVLISFLGVAIIISFVYTYLYSNEVLNDLPIGVVDNDNTTHSRKLSRMIDQTSQTKIYNHYISLTEAKKEFDQDKLRGIVVIPANFSRKLQRNEQPVVSIYADASYMLYYKQVLTAVKTSVAYMNAGIQIKKKSAQGNLPKQSLDRVVAVKGKTIGLYNPSSGYATFLMPIVLVIIFQTTMLTSIGILGGTIREEKKIYELYPYSDNLLGTLPIVMGKATTYLIISLGILMIILGILMPVFNIPMRASFLSVIVFMIPFFLSIVYLGVFLNTLFKQRESAILFVMFISLPSLMLTGFSYPAEMMPKWVQIFSYFLPSTMATKGFVGLTQMGASFSLIKEYWLWLWGVCVFYLVLSLLSSKFVFMTEKKKQQVL